MLPPVAQQQALAHNRRRNPDYEMPGSRGDHWQQPRSNGMPAGQNIAQQLIGNMFHSPLHSPTNRPSEHKGFNTTSNKK